LGIVIKVSGNLNSQTSALVLNIALNKVHLHFPSVLKFVLIPDGRHNNTRRGKSTTASQLSSRRNRAAKASVSEVCFPVSVFISSDKGRKQRMDGHRNGDYIKTQEWVKYVFIPLKFLKFSFSLSKFFVGFCSL